MKCTGYFAWLIASLRPSSSRTIVSKCSRRCSSICNLTWRDVAQIEHAPPITAPTKPARAGIKTAGSVQCSGAMVTFPYGLVAWRCPPRRLPRRYSPPKSPLRRRCQSWGARTPRKSARHTLSAFSTRMGVHRMTRLTNALSKMNNLWRADCLWLAYCNSRSHSGSPSTPARSTCPCVAGRRNGRRGAWRVISWGIPSHR